MIPLIDYIVVVVNTICTLRCRNCLTRTPYLTQQGNYPKENILRDIDMCFRIYRHISHIDLEGGETLLHPDIADIVRYSHQFIEKGSCEEVRIITNCTVLPDEKLISASKEIIQTNNKGILFILDDYGPNLSTKKDGFVKILQAHNIPYRIHTYWGDDMHWNGWIDFGDFTLKDKTQEQLERQFKRCHMAHNYNTQRNNPYIKNGKAYLCAIQLSELRHIKIVKNEIIDLHDNATTIEDKIKIAGKFGKKPINHCKYCNGYIVESKRLIPAEQLTQNELKILRERVFLSKEELC